MDDSIIKETSINGIVENVVFHNSSNGFTVLEINISGEIITAVGSLVSIAPGEEVCLHGTWNCHEIFGRQFKIEKCERSLPDTVAKLYRYLSSSAVKGIGPKTALKIIEKFKEDSFNVLENEPDRLALINGISKKKAIEISNEFNRQRTMRKIMIELENFGISAGECAAIYKYFGVTALEIIRQNPYILCDNINGFTFERADELTALMGLSPDPVFRLRAGILHIIRHNLGNGHTCIPRKKMYKPAMALLNTEKETVTEIIDELISMRQLVSAHINGDEMLFLPELYNAEISIAKRIRNIIKFPPSPIKALESDIKKTEAANGIFYAAKQKEAIITAANKGLLILTGGPGAGKTTAVRGMLDVFERKNIKALLCAPTGMAAKRMTEVTGREAKTIHRLLEVEWDGSDKPQFRRNAENPLSAGVVIVDELSMVDVVLFASLLDAIPISCRIVLVGDSDQLPSVGPGNVLNDLISSGSLPVVCLTEIFRQAQKSLIIMNAHRIIAGERPVMDCIDSDFFFILRDNSISAADTVIQLISQRLPKAYGFSSFDDIQILCPSRKGDCGTVNLNRRLQVVLNPFDKSKNELKTSGGRIFREGDRVMQIKNNYNIIWKRKNEEGCGVFNGDIGILRKINYAAGTIKIEFDDKLADYSADNLSELELAYAVTVHKSQGSEYPVVIIPVIDCPPMLMYRNLLYTGVTRAKKILIIVGNSERVYDMASNNKRTKRYSALKAFLSD